MRTGYKVSKIIAHVPPYIKTYSRPADRFMHIDTMANEFHSSSIFVKGRKRTDPYLRLIA